MSSKGGKGKKKKTLSVLHEIKSGQPLQNSGESTDSCSVALSCSSPVLETIHPLYCTVLTDTWGECTRGTWPTSAWLSSWPVFYARHFLESVVLSRKEERSAASVLSLFLGTLVGVALSALARVSGAFGNDHPEFYARMANEAFSTFAFPFGRCLRLFEEESLFDRVLYGVLAPTWVFRGKTHAHTHTRTHMVWSHGNGKSNV